MKFRGKGANTELLGRLLYEISIIHSSRDTMLGTALLLRLLLANMCVRWERRGGEYAEMVEYISPVFLMLNTKLISLQSFVQLYVFSPQCLVLGDHELILTCLAQYQLQKCTQ